MCEHATRPLRGVHAVTHPRRRGQELVVQRVLVLQAAHQATAGARDLHRVGREVLVTGHPHRHRVEVDEEGGAAGVAPARSDPALDAGVVARGELGEHHLAVERLRDRAHELAEVDAAAGREVDRGGGASTLVTDVGPVDSADLHGQLVLADQPLRRHLDAGALRAVGLIPGDVGRARGADADGETADRTLDLLGPPHDLDDLGGRRGREEDLVAHAGIVRPGVEVVEATVARERDGHHARHAVIPRAPGSRRREHRGPRRGASAPARSAPGTRTRRDTTCCTHAQPGRRSRCPRCPRRRSWAPR